MNHWINDAIFYHIYPLGFCGAPAKNDFHSAPVPRLEKIYQWLDHLQELGVNALYLGPVFESSRHGYDTADYFHVDRRLGTNETLMRLSQELHRRGMRLVLDGVFNHVGRDFWAFRDVRAHLARSQYCEWFQGLDFDQPGYFGDPFTYEGWNHHYELVKLNLANPWVRDHLFQAVGEWVREFAIDGLRLDAADCLDLDFVRELSETCRQTRRHFWLMGEVIHGDYRQWVNPQMLDSVTNYECYKGLFSSHVGHNYFEIAYALNRQFGNEGIYRDLLLYAFADNHDVNRVASSLRNPAHLYPLHCILFTMPGIPSIYYGSEWGIEGKRSTYSDQALRPDLDLHRVSQESPQRDLEKTIRTLISIRHSSRALRYGAYHPLYVNHEQLAFLRQWKDELAIVAVNAADKPVWIDLHLPQNDDRRLHDLLNQGERIMVKGGRLQLEVMPTWARILV